MPPGHGSSYSQFNHILLSVHQRLGASRTQAHSSTFANMKAILAILCLVFAVFTVASPVAVPDAAPDAVNLPRGKSLRDCSVIIGPYSSLQWFRF